MRLLLFTLCFLSFSSFAEKIRLVLSVNGVSYTSRQIQIYMNFREALRDQPNLALVNEKNFSDALQVFTEEMIILQEQQRMSGYQAPVEALEKARQRLDRRSDPQFQHFLRALKPTDTEKRRFLSEILSVTFYRQTRAKRLDDASWLKPLVERAIVRHYVQ